MVFYKNNFLEFDYQKPILLITIKNFKATDKELQQTEMVLKKFYNMKDNGEPAKFAFIFVIEKIGLFSVPVVHKIGNIFNGTREQAQKQLYGSAVVIQSDIKKLVNRFLRMFNNDRPVTFVDNIQEARQAVQVYIQNGIQK